MADLRLRAQALRDLRRIAVIGTREHGAAASERHLEGFERLFQLLRDQPFAGQELSAFRDGVRSLSHRPHRILYRIVGDIVLVIRIVHQSRDLERVLRSPQ